MNDLLLWITEKIIQTGKTLKFQKEAHKITGGMTRQIRATQKDLIMLKKLRDICESIPDRLNYWILQLSIDGANTKAETVENIQKYLKEMRLK